MALGRALAARIARLAARAQRRHAHCPALAPPRSAAAARSATVRDAIGAKEAADPSLKRRDTSVAGLRAGSTCGQPSAARQRCALPWGRWRLRPRALVAQCGTAVRRSAATARPGAAATRPRASCPARRRGPEVAAQQVDCVLRRCTRSARAEQRSAAPPRAQRTAHAPAPPAFRARRTCDRVAAAAGGCRRRKRGTTADVDALSDGRTTPQQLGALCDEL
jgi:hypothetical protein